MDYMLIEERCLEKMNPILQNAKVQQDRVGVVKDEAEMKQILLARL